MIFHEPDDTGFPNWSGQAVRGGDPIIWEKKLHLDNTKTLMVYQVNNDGTLTSVTNATIEGRYNSVPFTDADYEDLSVGHDLSSAPSSYTPYKIRLTAAAGSSILDKHFKLVLV